MIYDFIAPNNSRGIPMYLQLYQSIKKSIENGDLAYNVKLPSIRKLSEDLSISRTTTENAYNQLCAEGYIKNSPQRGYYVQNISYEQKQSQAAAAVSKSTTAALPVKYDFSGKSVDTDDINLKLWKRYIKNVLNCEYLIAAYGNPQGEIELRNALADYSYSVRGVCADSDNIIIGAGTQPLLYMICGLLRSCGDKIAMEKVGFTHAEQVFKDCGMTTVKVENDESGINLQSLKDSGAKILLVNPSGNLTTGQTTKMNRRMELIKWAQDNNAVIIEDDYNGELRYSTHPIPAMQSYGKDCVIYMGSFSKLLLPSVRISYAALPLTIISKYKNNIEHYNQTASKIEQLALAKYITDGCMEKHLRKLRKIYSEKSKVLVQALANNFGSMAQIKLLETTLCVRVEITNAVNINKLYIELLKQDIKIIKHKNCDSYFDLSFSGIETDAISESITKIKNTVDKINCV